MKNDMGKCVIERPRRGSHWRCAKARSFGKFVKDDEGNIDYEGISRIPTSWKKYGSDHREFSDVLGPLNGYLINSCGRLWNDVYSEIAQVLGRAGYALGHIITDHLDVETCTFRGDDGEVWYCGKSGVFPIRHSYRWTQFYVEPQTGVLQMIEPRRYRTFTRRQREAAKPIEYIKIADGQAYQKFSGLWYYTRYVIVDSVEEYKTWSGGNTMYRQIKKEQVMFKRQLGKKDLRDLRLKNDLYRKVA